MHFVEHFAGNIHIAIFIQALEENVGCSDARLDFERFEDTMKGYTFHCELDALSAASPPPKLSFNTATLSKSLDRKISFEHAICQCASHSVLVFFFPNILYASLSIRESQDWAFLKSNKNYKIFIQRAKRITSNIFSIWGSWWRKLQQKLCNKYYIKNYNKN